MSENIKDKAARYRALAKDETFVELLQTVADKQVAVFLAPGSSDEAIDKARSIVLALETIETSIQAILTEEAVFDKNNP